MQKKIVRHVPVRKHPLFKDRFTRKIRKVKEMKAKSEGVDIMTDASARRDIGFARDFCLLST